MNIRCLLLFPLLATSAGSISAASDYTRIMGGPVAKFLSKEKDPAKLSTIADFWKGKSFPLKKDQLDLEIYRIKIDNFKTMHERYLSLVAQDDPDWGLFTKEQETYHFHDLLGILDLGDFLVCQSDFLDKLACCLRKKIAHKPKHYKEWKEEIEHSAFKIRQTSLKKVGTCLFDVMSTAYMFKVFGAYTCSSVNFFAEYNKKILVLPQNNHRKIARICLDGKNDGNFISTNEEGNDTLLLTKPKKPFLWRLGKNNTPKTVSIGAFTITASPTNVDQRLITVKKGAETLATLTCNRPSQILLNEDCFVCAPTIREEKDEEARSAIIVNFKTGRHYRFVGEWTPKSQWSIGLEKKFGSSFFRPTVYYAQGTVFIRWGENKIDCFNLTAEVHKVYDSGLKIMALQVSPDGKYLVICEKQPGAFSIKNPLSDKYTLRYQVYQLKPTLTKLAKQLRTALPPEQEDGIFAWVGSLLTFGKTGAPKALPENIFTANSKK